MSHTYTPSPTQLVSVTVPDDGDPEVAASVNTAFQQLADGIAYVGGAPVTSVNFNPTTVLTTVASGSDGAVFPGPSTLVTSSTVGFPSSGIIWGPTFGVITYTGTSGSTTFTGCTGGSGTVHTGDKVLAAMSWTCPTSVHRVMLEFWAGGGGGGGGGAGGTATTTFSSGGGGGGAALRRLALVDVTPGTLYALVCGYGGAGGAGGLAGSTPAVDGADGGDTMFLIQGGATLATAKGAKGGRGGDATNNSKFSISPPGGPVAASRFLTPASLFTDASVSLGFGPGFGGEGTTSQAGQQARTGTTSLEGNAGGAVGTAGSAGGGYPGGGPGGGGGGGPGGAGGPAGNGGNGNATTGIAGGGFSGGVTGGGYGGGGGGGGGSAGTTAGNGGGGGQGGSGQITLWPLR